MAYLGLMVSWQRRLAECLGRWVAAAELQPKRTQQFVLFELKARFPGFCTAFGDCWDRQDVVENNNGVLMTSQNRNPGVL